MGTESPDFQDCKVKIVQSFSPHKAFAGMSVLIVQRETTRAVEVSRRLFRATTPAVPSV